MEKTSHSRFLCFFSWPKIFKGPPGKKMTSALSTAFSRKKKKYKRGNINSWRGLYCLQFETIFIHWSHKIYRRQCSQKKVYLSPEGRLTFKDIYYGRVPSESREPSFINWEGETVSIWVMLDTCLKDLMRTEQFFPWSGYQPVFFLLWAKE